MSAIPAKDISRISVEAAHQKLVNGEKIFFVDTRSDAAWNKSDDKIIGAIRVPPDQAEQYLSAIPRDHEIVTYCT